ncbi:MAG: tetratricopeptide repeat protein [Bacteroidota bacterium]|nr:tetratricopeptide repeat protein [Bacteroidota bacterium]
MKLLYKGIISCIIFLMIPRTFYCQINVDSAYTIVNKLPNDSVKVNSIIDLAWKLRKKDPDKMLKLAQQAYTLSSDLKYEIGKAKSKMYIGVVFNIKGNSDTAILLYKEALTVFERKKDSTWIMSSNNNLGGLCLKNGDYNKALECYLKVMRISELRNDKKNIAVSYTGIAQVYYFQGNYSKSLECYKRNLKVLEELNDKPAICKLLNNMAGVLYILKRYKESLPVVQRSLALATELNMEKEKTNCYILFANIYSDMGDNKKAEPYYLKAIAIQRQSEDYEGLLISLFNISDIYITQKQFQKGLDYKFQALDLAKEMEDPFRIKEVYEGLSVVYSQMGDYKKAYDYQVLFMSLKDTLLNAETAKQAAEMNTKYETEKKDKELIKKDAEITVQSTKAEKQAAQRNYFIVGFILVGLLAVFIYRGYRQKNKANTIIEAQKKEVEHQKELIEEKNKEVSDSIHYAQRIQRALLASEKLLTDKLEDHFVLFNPKDIVSGDFYWASVLPNGHFGLVTADSTGHGVPGAIMSILNISCLNEAVNAQNLSEPNEILNFTRKKIIEHLANDGSAEGGKDGMDCSLISFDPDKKELKYASANNPVWIVRAQTELLEFAPDKMPVGKHDRDSVSFSQHAIPLQKGDIVYVFTDGMPDQFGGPKGKKFMYKQLKEVLISINNLSMKEQKEKLNNTINDWMKDVEQVDDITVIGIRI